jgi:methanogenic corrinoid protein MtbC1
VTEEEPVYPPGSGVCDVDAFRLRQDYLQGILSARRRPVLEMVMTAHAGGYSIPGIYVDVLQEALYEMGRLWEQNRITVADEHMGTAITQYVMSNLYEQMEVTGEQSGKAVITVVQGELHQVGANMVADVLEADGWDVMFLGTNVPKEEVLQAIRRHGANLVGISSTVFFNLPLVMNLVEAIRSEFSDNPPRIILGGGTFRMLTELPPALEGCMVARDIYEALALTRTVAAVER